MIGIFTTSGQASENQQEPDYMARLFRTSLNLNERKAPAPKGCAGRLCLQKFLDRCHGHSGTASRPPCQEETGNTCLTLSLLLSSPCQGISLAKCKLKPEAKNLDNAVTAISLPRTYNKVGGDEGGSGDASTLQSQETLCKHIDVFHFPGCKTIQKADVSKQASRYQGSSPNQNFRL